MFAKGLFPAFSGATQTENIFEAIFTKVKVGATHDKKNVSSLFSFFGLLTALQVSSITFLLSAASRLHAVPERVSLRAISQRSLIKGRVREQLPRTIRIEKIGKVNASKRSADLKLLETIR